MVLPYVGRDCRRVVICYIFGNSVTAQVGLVCRRNCCYYLVVEIVMEVRDGECVADY
jgi:hypothetical protein